MLCLDNHCVLVQEFITMNEEYRLTADCAKFETEWLPGKSTDDSRQRRRLEKIDKLVTALKEHYLLAKAHYSATGGEILCRPTQADLAMRAGTTQDSVSRCLKDEKAVILRTLWNNAENPKAIMNS
jgi:hypothetical protein